MDNTVALHKVMMVLRLRLLSNAISKPTHRISQAALDDLSLLAFSLVAFAGSVWIIYSA